MCWLSLSDAFLGSKLKLNKSSSFVREIIADRNNDEFGSLKEDRLTNSISPELISRLPDPRNSIYFTINKHEKKHHDFTDPHHGDADDDEEGMQRNSDLDDLF